MTHFIKSITPAGFKQRSKRLLNAIVARTELKRRVQELEARTNSLEKRLFDLQPENVPVPSEVAEALKEVLLGNKMPVDTNLCISKHDYMYQFLEKNTASKSEAYLQYINSGAHMMNVLHEIAARKWGGFSAVPAFLDFASGYGRLTRFVVKLLGPERIWISDIKAGAVAFQTEQFGVNGIVSTTNPGDFKIGRKFDLIFVGSLFSHLPASTFTSWLQRLCDGLSEDGVIVFTVHDESLVDQPRSKKTGIVFNPASDDELCGLGKDGRLAGNQYGTTYVDEDYVRHVIHNLSFGNKRYSRYPKAMWGFQDIYILSKNAKDDFSNLTLPSQRAVAKL